MLTHFKGLVCLAALTSLVASAARTNNPITCTWAFEQLSPISHAKTLLPIEEVSPGFFVTSGGKPTAAEVETSRRLLSRVGGSFLLAADLGNERGTPGFDGVLYDQHGMAESNVSLKGIDVSQLTFDNVGETIKVSRHKANQQLAKVYNFDQLLIERGFVQNQDGTLSPKSGMSYQQDRATRLERFLHLFGLRREAWRKTTVVYDVFSTDPSVIAPNGYVNGVLSQHTQVGRVMLKLFIADTNESLPQNSSGLTSLQENLKTHPNIKRYIFMFQNQTVIVEADRIEIRSAP